MFRHLRIIKIKFLDQNHIIKLKRLYLKESENKALSYLDILLKRKITDLDYLGMQIRLAYNQNPKLYENLMRQFILKSGSANGHGELSSSHNPIRWLGFINKKGIEAKFEINPLCFLHYPIQLEMVIQSPKLKCDIKLPANFHRISKEMQGDKQIYRFQLNPGYRNVTPIFSLQINNSCLVEINHVLKNSQKLLLLSENFDQVNNSRRELSPAIASVRPTNPFPQN